MKLKRSKKFAIIIASVAVIVLVVLIVIAVRGGAEDVPSEDTSTPGVDVSPSPEITPPPSGDITPGVTGELPPPSPEDTDPGPDPEASPPADPTPSGDPSPDPSAGDPSGDNFGLPVPPGTTTKVQTQRKADKLLSEFERVSEGFAGTWRTSLTIRKAYEFIFREDGSYNLRAFTSNTGEDFYTEEGSFVVYINPDHGEQSSSKDGSIYKYLLYLECNNEGYSFRFNWGSPAGKDFYFYHFDKHPEIDFNSSSFSRVEDTEETAG